MREVQPMSKNYESIKENYDKGFYTDKILRMLVGKRLGITKAEYEQITGEAYTA